MFPPRSLRITYAALEGTCLIDADTAMNLELVSNVSRGLHFPPATTLSLDLTLRPASS